jgi:hypothetical protein
MENTTSTTVSTATEKDRKGMERRSKTEQAEILKVIFYIVLLLLVSQYNECMIKSFNLQQKELYMFSFILEDQLK